MALATASRYPAPALVAPRTYVMCPPTHFAVTYRINPWMHPDRPVRAERAFEQWRRIEDSYLAQGHVVVPVTPAPGMPDMVFAANAGIVIDGRMLLARFRYPQRAGEENAFRAALTGLGLRDVTQAAYVNEGEGDYLLAGPVILGASGFRTDARAHDEVAEFSGRPVVGLELIDERFYHLDTALAVLRPGLVAYWPGAFSAASVSVLADLFPDAIIASEADTIAFGLNACSDATTVVMASGAPALATAIRSRGLSVVELDTSELQKAGGSVKCCTLEIRC